MNCQKALFTIPQSMRVGQVSYKKPRIFLHFTQHSSSATISRSFTGFFHGPCLRALSLILIMVYVLGNLIRYTLEYLVFFTSSVSTTSPGCPGPSSGSRVSISHLGLVSDYLTSSVSKYILQFTIPHGLCFILPWLRSPSLQLLPLTVLT